MGSNAQWWRPHILLIAPLLYGRSWPAPAEQHQKILDLIHWIALCEAALDDGWGLTLQQVGEEIS